MATHVSAPRQGKTPWVAPDLDLFPEADQGLVGGRRREQVFAAHGGVHLQLGDVEPASGPGLGVFAASPGARPSAPARPAAPSGRV